MLFCESWHRKDLLFFSGRKLNCIEACTMKPSHIFKAAGPLNVALQQKRLA
jgi:hypothetical protein